MHQERSLVGTVGAKTTDARPQMKVAEAMTQGIDLLPADMTVQAAARQMAEADVGAVLVGSEGAVQGVLTDRDIIIRVVVQGRDATTVTVREVMSASPITCSEDNTLEEAFDLMRSRQIRRLPVLNADQSLTGIITLSDLARHGLDPGAELLRRIAEPHRESDPAVAELSGREPTS
jgi:CBS domain-containing protein